jgi:hypothetical protein
MTSSNEPGCVACNRTAREIPLLTLDYQGKKFWICPQHLPMLIHDPRSLTGRLPGAEGMEPAEHHD